MSKIRFLLTLTILTNIINNGSCQSTGLKKNPISAECIKLNNVAVEHLKKFQYEKNDLKQLDTALIFLKKALKCDSTYFLAYSNMLTVYDDLHNYSQEMTIMNKLLTLSKNDPGGLIQKGILFEKTHKADSARMLYGQAYLMYRKKLQNSPDSVRLMLNLIFLKAIREGKDAAIRERSQQIKKHPKDSIELIEKTDFLNNFNRIEFLGLDNR